MSARKQYAHWSLSTHGDGSLRVPCWVKSFGDGLVSVGRDPMVFIIYDYGESDESWYDSRVRSADVTWTVEETMKAVDEADGKCPLERRQLE
jgi:hypothetical protein